MDDETPLKEDEFYVRDENKMKSWVNCIVRVYEKSSCGKDRLEYCPKKAKKNEAIFRSFDLTKVTKISKATDSKYPNVILMDAEVVGMFWLARKKDSLSVNIVAEWLDILKKVMGFLPSRSNSLASVTKDVQNLRHNKRPPLLKSHTNSQSVDESPCELFEVSLLPMYDAGTLQNLLQSNSNTKYTMQIASQVVFPSNKGKHVYWPMPAIVKYGIYNAEKNKFAIIVSDLCTSSAGCYVFESKEASIIQTAISKKMEKLIKCSNQIKDELYSFVPEDDDIDDDNHIYSQALKDEVECLEYIEYSVSELPPPILNRPPTFESIYSDKIELSRKQKIGDEFMYIDDNISTKTNETYYDDEDIYDN